MGVISLLIFGLQMHIWFHEGQKIPQLSYFIQLKSHLQANDPFFFWPSERCVGTFRETQLIA